MAEADDPACFTTIHKRHVVQGVGLGGEGDHANFVIPVSFVNPYKRGIPVEFGAECKGYAMLRLIGDALDRIEFDFYLQ